MANPYLNLHPDCIAAPTRLDIAVVQAAMLWPEDEATRTAYVRGAKIDALARMNESVPLRTSLAQAAERIRVEQELDRETLAHGPSWSAASELARIMVDAPRLRDLPDRTDEFVHGLIAGTILLRALASIGDDPVKSGLGHIMRDVASNFRRGLKKRLDPKTIHNAIWPRYRPVAHFWCSYLLRDQMKGSDTFPCWPQELGGFLILAESCRRQGETLRPFKSPNTVLDPDKTLRLPPSIPLPSVKIAFADFSVAPPQTG